MAGKKYIISCPICGKTLFKSNTTSNIEVQCPKCHSGLEIIHSKGVLSVKENEGIEYMATRDENTIK